MIAFPKERRPEVSAPAWHIKFMSLLPAIVAHARLSFKNLRPEAREEAIQAVVCNACAATARLAEVGKLDLAYAAPLARFGVAQVRAGRMTGGRLNCRDVMSRCCLVSKGILVERLDQYDAEEQCWQEILVPDRTCSPADLAATRVDFPAWLRTLSHRNRRIARFLSLGHSTGDASRKFGLSPARISQLRQELKASWEEFTGEFSVHLPEPTFAQAES